MQRRLMWLLLIIALVGLLAVVLVGPRLLHPPLSQAGLRGVESAKQIELQQAQAKLQNDVRATLLQGIGGLLLLAGAFATLWQVRVSREGQITERFSRAIDHLGSAKPDVRLGGIYTLERIAKDSPADRPTVEAVLAALVRTHAPWMAGIPGGPEHPSPTVDERLPTLEQRAVDVQTAMLILGRRPPSRNLLQLYLSRVDLRAAYLPEARLPNTLLRHANLAYAWMPGIDLDRSALRRADLRQANLQDARLTKADLFGAYLQDADLRGADLRQADLRAADLRGANLQGAQLEGADLTDARHDATTVWPDGFQPR